MVLFKPGLLDRLFTDHVIHYRNGDINYLYLWFLSFSHKKIM